MPWCPSCKTQYEQGVKVCPTCGTELSNEESDNIACLMSLPEEQASGLLAYYEYLGYSCCMVSRNKDTGLFDVLVPSDLQEVLADHADHYLKENPDIPNAAAKDEREILRPSSGAYVQKSKQLENIRSAAFSFLLVGLAGLAAVVLIIAGILPFPFAGSSKALTLAVMGALFIIFTAVGTANMKKISQLKQEVDAEQHNTQDICDWFFSSYSAKDVDEGLELTGIPEQDYYLRTDKIRRLMADKAVEDPSYEDFLLEQIYARLYE